MSSTNGPVRQALMVRTAAYCSVTDMTVALETGLYRASLLVRLLGAFPVTVSGGMFQLSGPRVLLASLQILFMFSLWFHWSTRKEVSPPIISFLVIIHGICIQALLPVNFIWTMLNINRLNRMMEMFSSIDLSLRRLGLKCENRLRWGYFSAQCFSVCCVMVFMYFAQYPKNRYFYNIAPIFPMVATVQFFSFLGDLLSERFAALVSNMVASANNLTLLTSVYKDLWYLSGEINSLFSPQILNISTSSLCTIVVDSFFITKNFQPGNGIDFSNSAVLCMLCLDILYALFAMNIISSCNSASSKAKEFNAQLYQLMIDDKTEGISNDKKLRLHIAMKRDVIFTACGFFTLDYTLVHSMIAAATTYLVILIQFGQPTSKSPPGSPGNVSSLLNVTELPLALTTIASTS